jgi:dynein heavy chain
MSGFISKVLGEYFIEEVFIPLESTYHLSDCTTPIVYILSPGDDPQSELKIFAADKGRTIQTISLGRGQGTYASNIIRECCLQNVWVLLQNCH